MKMLSKIVLVFVCLMTGPFSLADVIGKVRFDAMVKSYSEDTVKISVGEKTYFVPRKAIRSVKLLSGETYEVALAHHEYLNMRNKHLVSTKKK